MRPELPTGTVTFLFTDIEGSTRLLHALGPDTYAEALAEHRRVLREAFAEHGGVEVDTQGDAFFVAFATAPGAAAAAREGLAALEPGPIRVRMGLHTGTPTVTAEGYVGVDVHRGARVAALAHGGQALLTEATSALLDAQATLVDLGRHRLKDFDGPARLLQLGDRDFPPLRTPGTVSLPTPATPFVGREQELHDAVTIVLERDPRILTVLGPGGTGKTRFGLELARLLAEDAEGGTLFVPLATLRDAALVLPAVAEALGAESPEPAAIAARVGEKRTHVLLDNLEQLLPAAAAQLSALVDASPSLRLLVTSREAVQVAPETRFDLPPLTADDAVAFFVARARAVDPRFEGSRIVAALCERLDRLPLALELAAARTRLLAPESLLERLSARLDLPGARDADPRHATLRATIEWSYDLLSPREQELFADLAVFRGGCTLEAAEEVCDADLDTLASLIDKSLLRRRTSADGSDRYWMLETIHEFATARLEAREERLEELRAGHARRMLTLARSANLHADVEPVTPRFELIRPEIEDTRSALDWATDADPVLAAHLVEALELLWVTQALDEGRRRTEELLRHGPAIPAPLRAALHTIHGGTTILLESDQAAGEPSYEAARRLYDELDDMRGEARIVMRLAVHAGTRGDAEEARRLIGVVRTLTEGLDLPVLEAQSFGTLASLAENEGDVDAALELYDRSANIAAKCGFTLWETWMRTSVADIAIRLGRYELAASAARVALESAWEQGDRRIGVHALALLARSALESGDRERAGRLWGGVVAESDGGDVVPADDDFRQVTEPLCAADDPAFAAGLETGRAGLLDDAVAFALTAR